MEFWVFPRVIEPQNSRDAKRSKTSLARCTRWLINMEIWCMELVRNRPSNNARSVSYNSTRRIARMGRCCCSLVSPSRLLSASIITSASLPLFCTATSAYRCSIRLALVALYRVKTSLVGASSSVSEHGPGIPPSSPAPLRCSGQTS